MTTVGLVGTIDEKLSTMLSNNDILNLKADMIFRNITVFESLAGTESVASCLSVRLFWSQDCIWKIWLNNKIIWCIK